MADKRKTILLRISPQLWRELDRWAQDDLRSLNGQIEYLLREAARKRTGKPLVEDDSENPAGENG